MLTRIWRIVSEPVFRRFLLATALAAAFIWTAVEFFNVQTDVVVVFLIMSFVLVAVIMVLALVGGLILRLLRRRSTLNFEVQPPGIEEGSEKNSEKI